MKRESGEKESPIWLLGDSNPKEWEKYLDAPFDRRHPAIHNIWTPIIDVIQDGVFKKINKRVDTTRFYTRNAIEESSRKPDKKRDENNKTDENQGWKDINDEIEAFKDIVAEFNPKIVIIFGSFAFEFVLRAIAKQPRKPQKIKYWTTHRLATEFISRVTNWSGSQTTNVFPLLHATIARRYFLQSHNYFCVGNDSSKWGNNNYFDFVGSHLAQMLIKQHEERQPWIKSIWV